MNCEKVMFDFEQHDNKKTIPLKMRLHFIVCSECRREAGRMTRALNFLQGEHVYEMKNSVADNVMKIIMLSSNRYEKSAAYGRWIIAGVLIVAGHYGLNYSESHTWLTSYYGQTLSVPFNIVMGVIITVYAGVFIFTHLDDIKKYVFKE